MFQMLHFTGIYIVASAHMAGPAKKRYCNRSSQDKIEPLTYPSSTVRPLRAPTALKKTIVQGFVPLSHKDCSLHISLHPAMRLTLARVVELSGVDVRDVQRLNASGQGITGAFLDYLRGYLSNAVLL